MCVFDILYITQIITSVKLNGTTEILILKNYIISNSLKIIKLVQRTHRYLTVLYLDFYQLLTFSFIYHLFFLSTKLFIVSGFSVIVEKKPIHLYFLLGLIQFIIFI